LGVPALAMPPAQPQSRESTMPPACRLRGRRQPVPVRTRPATGWPRGASLRTFDLEVVVEADAADDAEAEARHDGDGGTDFREDAAFRHAGFCEAELAADEQVHAGVEARADTEADTAACVDADGGVTHVDTQVVQGVDTDGEAGGADVVVARVDADRQAGRHVFDTEV